MEFSLADMFRLLTTGSKTGILHVVSDTVEGLVCFRDGRVCFASATGLGEPTGKRLVQAGIISDKQLRQAKGLMKIQKRDKAQRRLGQILVDEGYLEPGILERFLLEQVATALFDLMRLEDGQLRFQPDEPCDEVEIGISVSTEEALAEADKRLEVWNRIREKIPSLDARFAMAAAPGSNSAEINLKPREWMVLCFLHGSRSVAELADLTGYTQFETARTLYAMYANGLITRVGASGESLSDE